MKGIPTVMVCALALALSVAPTLTSADETKTVRGTVTSIGGDSITVKAMDKDMTFKVDKTTEVVAKGGGTAMREAQKLGAAGVKLTDIVKVGEGVEVKYHEMGGAMHATMIRGGISTGATATTGEAEEPETKRVTGKVTRVAADSFVISAEGKEWTFKVDKSTYVEGKGGTTKMRALEQEGKPSTLDQFLQMNDEVQVEYADMAGAMHAKEIRVLAKTR
jgi:hypothetical protein